MLPFARCRHATFFSILRFRDLPPLYELRCRQRFYAAPFLFAIRMIALMPFSPPPCRCPPPTAASLLPSRLIPLSCRHLLAMHAAMLPAFQCRSANHAAAAAMFHAALRRVALTRQQSRR